MNDITKLLCLADNDITVKNVSIANDTRIVEIEKKLYPTYCPVCGERMYSRGMHLRDLNHPILQDGSKLILRIHQRKWRCSNDVCRFTCNDYFSFHEPYKQSTSILPILILKELKDINVPISKVAERMNISDTQVFYTFMKHVHFERLPLSEIISIDEVCLDIGNESKYVMVILLSCLEDSVKRFWLLLLK